MILLEANMSNTLKIGLAIKTFRKYNNLSLQDFSQKLNKALPTVKKYESDDILVPLDTLDDICKILNVTLDQLWFLARLNIEQNLKDCVVRNLQHLDLEANFTNNDYIIISSNTTLAPVSIAADYAILRNYINTVYYELHPISSLISEKVIYLAIIQYWQDHIMPQIEKALDQSSQRSIYQDRTKCFIERAAKERQGLELLKNIVINTNNPNNEIAHIIPLLQEIDKGITKIL